MFEIGWTEILFVAIIAIFVLKPKDYPEALRAIGNFLTRARQMAGEFQSQFNDAMRDANLDDVRKTIDEIRDLKNMGPMQQVREHLTSFADDAKKSVESPVVPSALAPDPYVGPMATTSDPYTGGTVPATNDPYSGSTTSTASVDPYTGQAAATSISAIPTPPELPTAPPLELVPPAAAAPAPAASPAAAATPPAPSPAASESPPASTATTPAHGPDRAA